MTVDTGGSNAHLADESSGPVPDLAVVVLSLGAPPELADAIVSLLAMEEPLEIVIVNSGGGDPGGALPAGLPPISIISVEEVLWPGAVRNLGIRATRAPWIAFLASDHTVDKSWATHRLAWHRRGHNAVGSALVTTNPNNPVAWAAHLALSVRRLPGVPREHALPYGASYARALFDEYGEFREDLRIGEDTEFHARLRSEDRPVWAPAVRATHRNPTNLIDLVSSQYGRGWRSGYHWPPGRYRPIARRIHHRFTSIASLSRRSVKGRERLIVYASWPLLLLSVCVYETGVSAGRRALRREGGTHPAVR